MHIAICDDNPQELKRIARTVEKYASTSSWPVRYQLFSDAETMLKAAETEDFTHYFLDIMMPCMDGISAAQEIRSFDKDAVIVFLTSFKEYAYQSYRVKAYDYLLKPVVEDQLAELLTQLQSQEERAEECICVQNGRSVFRIPLVRISHLEVYQKKLYFHLTDGQVRQTTGTMAQSGAELLIHPNFLKIHRSYIVNLHQISTLSPDGCVMLSGVNLPISRLLYNQVRQEYIAHLFGTTGV